MQSTLQKAGFSLQTHDLAVGRQGEVLFGGINLTLEANSSLAVIGESGSGKTTLVHTLAGLMPAVGGTLSWTCRESQRAPRTAMVWQSLALFPWMRVEDNLALPLRLQHVHSPVQIAERTREMLSELELEGLERRFPHELSGGQRQRLALGRALIASPDILFMDEPFSALDAVLREHLQDFLKRLREKNPCTMVFVTHDIAEAVYLGEAIVLLGAKPSRVAAFGKNSAFVADPAVNVRETDDFYRVQRHLHEAFRVGLSHEIH